jgi:hypothetical protein
MGDLLEDGCLAHPALAVDDQDVVNIFSGQAALNPAKDIFAPEKHAGLEDGSSGDVRIEQWFTHRER